MDQPSIAWDGCERTFGDSVYVSGGDSTVGSNHGRGSFDDRGC